MNCTQDLYYCLSSSGICFSDLLGAVCLLNFAQRSAHGAWHTAHEFSAFGFITTKEFEGMDFQDFLKFSFFFLNYI